MLSPIGRSAWCYAVSVCCRPHLELQADEDGFDLAPLNKLVSKLGNYLNGELKSHSNLERFFNEFIESRDQYELSDSLNGRISELAFSAITGAFDALNDDECDDTDLISASLNDLFDELDELGGESAPLRAYWQELDQEWKAALASTKQRPIARDIMKSITETDVSMFGLEG
jgi:hypothetical protein